MSDLALAAKYIGGALILACAFSAAAIGVSNIIAEWIKSVSRNPEAAGKVNLPGVIGLAAVELIALFSALAFFLLFI